MGECENESPTARCSHGVDGENSSRENQAGERDICNQN